VPGYDPLPSRAAAPGGALIPPESHRRESWRADVAEHDLGCTPMVAAALAIDPLVDVCTARELVAKGCPPATAIYLATRES
jgi:hypothetical protein